ncbi:tripartite tricarboxylate transporter TctB family protein [Lentibacillus sp. CBA3610]|uniref:tripartite tricarboxylate transporter TctB family protein n=1 Tax=Lentibacillus sp. CBA3610 TaxID=2518176 RepID=UPI00159507CC|nr:tripartite tricarboxylate transporter TctB family protein [Lentibacillus sp. CBA3610]QKY70053.1 tripartite tricarboxylate transporter TctB family protein [Lentibacillus sp. CBA3610]
MSYLVKHSIGSIFILILSIVFFIESLNYPASAARLPQILIIIIALLGIGMYIEAFMKYKKEKEEISKAEKKKAEELNVKRVLLFGTLIALYIILIDVIGYFLLTPIFLFVALTYLKATKITTAILLSIVFTAFIYGLFSMFLNIPLPMGIFS